MRPRTLTPSCSFAQAMVPSLTHQLSDFLDTRAPCHIALISSSPEAAQKNTRDSLGAASAAAVRTGEYVHSALAHPTCDSLVFMVVRVLSPPTLSLNPPN